MGRLHKHSNDYHRMYIKNCYQYFLRRNINDDEYRYYTNLNDTAILNIVSSSAEAKSIIAQSLDARAINDFDKIPYTVIKINDRAETILKPMHEQLHDKFTYKNDIEFVDYRKDDVHDFFKQRNINIAWLGSLFGLASEPLEHELAVFASHIKCLEYIVKNNIPEMIVMEDDVILTFDFIHKFKKAYSSLPNNYDFLSDSVVMPNYEELSTNDQYMLTDNLLLNKGYLQNAYMCFTLYSYNGAKKILDYFKHYGVICPIDTMLFHLNRENKLNGYSTYYHTRFIESTDFLGTFRNQRHNNTQTVRDEEIDVITMVYNRPEYFSEMMDKLSKQTIKFNLHVISNKLEYNNYYKTIVEKYKLNGMNIKFIESDNSRMAAERWFYIKDNLLTKEYTIVIDDDVFINPQTIEQIWNTREKNTIKSYFGRKFLTSQDPLTEEIIETAGTVHAPELSISSMSLGVVDNSYFEEASLFFQLKDQYPEIFYKFEDMMLSWAVNKAGGTIKNHWIRPIANMGDTDDKALYKFLSNIILESYQQMDDVYKFKRF